MTTSLRTILTLLTLLALSVAVLASTPSAQARNIKATCTHQVPTNSGTPSDSGTPSNSGTPSDSGTPTQSGLAALSSDKGSGNSGKGKGDKAKSDSQSGLPCDAVTITVRLENQDTALAAGTKASLCLLTTCVNDLVPQAVSTNPGGKERKGDKKSYTITNAFTGVGPFKCGSHVRVSGSYNSVVKKGKNKGKTRVISFKGNPELSCKKA